MFSHVVLGANDIEQSKQFPDYHHASATQDYT